LFASAAVVAGFTFHKRFAIAWFCIALFACFFVTGFKGWKRKAKDAITRGS